MYGMRFIPQCRYSSREKGPCNHFRLLGSLCLRLASCNLESENVSGRKHTEIEVILGNTQFLLNHIAGVSRHDFIILFAIGECPWLLWLRSRCDWDWVRLGRRYRLCWCSWDGDAIVIASEEGCACGSHCWVPGLEISGCECAYFCGDDAACIA